MTMPPATIHTERKRIPGTIDVTLIPPRKKGGVYEYRIIFTAKGYYPDLSRRDVTLEIGGNRMPAHPQLLGNPGRSKTQVGIYVEPEYLKYFQEFTR